MVAIGLLVVSGALLNMLLIGVKAWIVCCLTGGAFAILLGSSPIKNRLFPAGGRPLAIYNVILAAVVLIAVLAVPAMLDNSPGPEQLNRAIKKSASLIAAGEPDRAEILLKALADEYGGLDEIALNLSTIYLMKGKPDEAAVILDAGKQIRNFNADECFNYALTYYQREYYADALLYLINALQQNPEMEDACLYACECARRLDNYQAARFFCRRFIELRPDLPRGFVQLAKIELMVMDYGEASGVLKKAMELKPDDLLEQEIIRLQEDVDYYQSKLIPAGI